MRKSVSTEANFETDLDSFSRAMHNLRLTLCKVVIEYYKYKQVIASLKYLVIGVSKEIFCNRMTVERSRFRHVHFHPVRVPGLIGQSSRDTCGHQSRKITSNEGSPDGLCKIHSPFRGERRKTTCIVQQEVGEQRWIYRHAFVWTEIC